MKIKGAVLRLGAEYLAVSAMIGVMAVFLFVFRGDTASGAAEGIRLCGRVVIPTLFPFMFLAEFTGRTAASRLLGRIVSPVCNLLFGVRGRSATAVLLSFFSGYPVSAKLISHLRQKGEIDGIQAERMIRFCVNPGPAFCISAVGGTMLGSAKAGVVLLASTFSASVIMGVFSAQRCRPLPPNAEGQGSIGEAFCEACESAVRSTMAICGYTILFSAFLAPVIYRMGEWVPILPLLEITTGLSHLGRVPLPLYAAYISFGGLAVQFQVLALGRGAGIRFSHIFLSRAACALISAAVCFLLLRFFPVDLPDLPTISARLQSGQGGLMASLSLFCSAAVFLGYLGQILFGKNQII